MLPALWPFFGFRIREYWMSHHRSRRLRKKLHIDEFQELGFEVAFRLRDGLSADEMGAFWDAFIGDAIEGNGLLYGGSTRGMACLRKRGSANEQHREAVRSWLAGRSEVSETEVGPLIDVWYPAA